MNYIILDMEWNQAMDRAHTVQEPVLLRGEIIQIGAVKCDENFNLVDKLKINVAPKYYRKMNRHVEKITGITSAMLAKGLPFPEAFARLKEWCSPEYGSDYVNLQLIYKNQIDNERVQWSLSDAVEKLGIPLDAQAHDAMNDAWFTYEVCRKLDMQRGLAEYAGMSPGQRPVISREIFRDIHDIRRITSDEKITAVPCPECGRMLNNGEWLSLGVVRRNDICTCPDHGDFLVKVVCKRASADRWTVTRSVYKSDDEALESYQKKIEKQHAAIERRKAAAAKENADDNDRTV